YSLLYLSVWVLSRTFSILIARAEARKDRLLVFFHQRAHPAVECFHHLLFALLHLCEINARAVDHNTVFSRLFLDEGKMIARREKCFAWNAPYVQASAA